MPCCKGDCQVILKWTFVYAAQPRDPCDCSAKLQYIPGCSLLFRLHPFGKDPDNRGPLLSHCDLLSFQLHGTFTLILTEAKIKGCFVSGGLFISTQKRKRGGFDENQPKRSCTTRCNLLDRDSARFTCRYLEKYYEKLHFISLNLYLFLCLLFLNYSSFTFISLKYCLGNTCLFKL